MNNNISDQPHSIDSFALDNKILIDVLQDAQELRSAINDYAEAANEALVNGGSEGIAAVQDYFSEHREFPAKSMVIDSNDPEFNRHQRIWEINKKRHLTPENQSILFDYGSYLDIVFLHDISNLIPEIQMKIAKESGRLARYMLTFNASLTPEVQLVLAKDPERDIRDKLRNHPALTFDARMTIFTNNLSDERTG